MQSPGMLRRVALVRTDVSEEHNVSNITVKSIGELGRTLLIINNRRTLRRNTISISINSVRRLLVTANVVPSSPILVTLMMEALRSSETSVLTRATRRNIPEDGILHSYRRENLKSYIALTNWTCSGEVMCLLRSTNWHFIFQKTTFFIVTALKTSNLT
jgi:hypothetical protein